MVLDVFFSFAVPVVIVGVIVAKLMLAYSAKNGVYVSKEDKRVRSNINTKYKTNFFSGIIAIVFFLIYLLIVASLIDQWGWRLFTVVICILMILPVTTLCAVFLLLYNGLVHFYANHIKKP